MLLLPRVGAQESLDQTVFWAREDAERSSQPRGADPNSASLRSHNFRRPSGANRLAKAPALTRRRPAAR